MCSLYVEIGNNMLVIGFTDNFFHMDTGMFYCLDLIFKQRLPRVAYRWCRKSRNEFYGCASFGLVALK